MNKEQEFIQLHSGAGASAIIAVSHLLDQGATIPFIARYRKEKTGGLDEVGIEKIKEAKEAFSELISRKSSILKSIEEQEKLTSELRRKIESCYDLKILEDIYLPYKRKASTRASQARDAGLEPLANIIFWNKTSDLNRSAKQFLSKKIHSVEDAIQGARDIMAEMVSEHEIAREMTREIFQRSCHLLVKPARGKKEEALQYKNYFDFSQSLTRIPSHRYLAICRGENEKLLSVKLEIDEERLFSRLGRYFKYDENDCGREKAKAIKDGMKRLLIPAISTEFRQEAKDRADEEAIQVFAQNLKQLLLQPPLGEKRIIAIDPGFKTGCKIAILDEKGKYLEKGTIFPHPPQNQTEKAKKSLESLIHKYNIEALAIGNGTAGRETMQWVNKWLSKSVEVHLVNESGASIYSASPAARKEFPNLDVTVRGAISIGRRLMDPLAELIKIDPKSIGVGQYQHDVKQKLLKSRLDQVVMNCVNSVGVNLNTASKDLLAYVSGLGPSLAQNIIEYRDQKKGIHSREELHKIPRLGAKAFEQCAGFLRIKDGFNPLDNTGIHPEQYGLIEKICRINELRDTDLINNPSAINNIDWHQFVSDEIGMPTLQDIKKELLHPGLDPRGVAEIHHFTEGIRGIEDLKGGMILQGVVTNLTKFGAFVDIGIKENALIHISQITDQFIKDPSEYLQLGQSIKAKVIDLDINRKRISLSMKDIQE